MVIGLAACDNVEWGGLDLSVVPPPPRTGPSAPDVQTGDRLPEGPVLYHVTRDSAATTMVPIGVIVDQELQRISVGDDAAEFGDRFTTAFLREGAEFTLFRRGRRAGTLIVDSAAVPTSACRPLPRATGQVEISGNAGNATEFLAMARTQAPEGRMIPGDTVEVERRMQVVGNILAERALRTRDAPLPNWARARRQLLPFPVSATRDLGFTATFLVDDELAIGNDDQGYSLYIVYTPQAQTGYDTAYVAYTSYTAAGKAAPRTVDYLDWDRDGRVELLLEVFGTRDSWFAAVGADGDDNWSRTFEDRCDPGATTAPADTAATDSAGDAPTPTPPDTPAATPQSSSQSASPQRRSGQAAPARQPDRASPLPRIEPRVRLSDPGARRGAPPARDTNPDTSETRRTADR